MPQKPSKPAEKFSIVLKTQAEVARFFDVHRSTVGDWVQRGMPGRDGHYCARAITNWRTLVKRLEVGERPDRLIGAFLNGTCLYDCGCGLPDDGKAETLK